MNEPAESLELPEPAPTRSEAVAAFGLLIDELEESGLVTAISIYSTIAPVVSASTPNDP